MKREANILFFLLMLIPLLSVGQNPNKLLREGNTAYEDKKFDQSELKYRKSLEADKNSSIGLFNLGDALYKQEKFEEAEDKFREALSIEQNKPKPKVDPAKIHHNLGNSLLKQEKYEESINAYKNALKINPRDDETRHNLALAQRMLKQQQQQDQNKEQDKDQQKQDQQKQKEQKEQQEQRQQQEQQNAEQNKQEQKEGQKPQPRNLTKEEAEKMLDALRNDERELQKKIKRAEPVRGTTEKNW